MAEFNILPLFTDAYLSDTRGLTAAQHGAYLLLLMTAWRLPSNGLPDDDDLLASWACMDRRTWLKNKPKVMAYFNLLGSEWHQERLDDERKRAAYVRDRQVQGGLSSALKRKEINSRHLPSKHHALHQPPSPSPSPSPNRDSKTLQFDEFWKIYPRKISKANALKSYLAQIKKGATHEAIINGLNSQLAHFATQEPRYIPHPATWLNGNRWTDDVQTTDDTKGKNTKPTAYERALFAGVHGTED